MALLHVKPCKKKTIKVLLLFLNYQILNFLFTSEMNNPDSEIRYQSFIFMWAFPKGNPTYSHRQRAGGMVGVVHESETSRMGMRNANLTLLNGSLGSTIRF